MSDELSTEAILGESAPGSGATVTQTMLQQLLRTGPWVRFLSVFGFVLSALSLLVGGVLMAVYIAASPGSPVIASIPAILVSTIAGSVYFFPSLLLSRYATAIKQLRIAGDVDNLERALFHQRRFWRLTGIMAIAVAGMYALGLLVVVASALLRGTK